MECSFPSCTVRLSIADETNPCYLCCSINSIDKRFCTLHLDHDQHKYKFICVFPGCKEPFTKQCLLCLREPDDKAVFCFCDVHHDHAHHKEAVQTATDLVMPVSSAAHAYIREASTSGSPPSSEFVKGAKKVTITRHGMVLALIEVSAEFLLGKKNSVSYYMKIGDNLDRFYRYYPWEAYMNYSAKPSSNLLLQAKQVCVCHLYTILTRNHHVWVRYGQLRKMRPK